MRASVVALSLIAVCLGTSSAVRAQTGPFGRLEAGTLNADDPFNATMAVGAAVGYTYRASSLMLRAVRQSWDGNSGADVAAGRTFALVEWELAGRTSGYWERQLFFRLGAGWLFQSPYKSTVANDLGVGIRYRLATRLFLVGSADDQLAWVRRQAFTSCEVGLCTTVIVPAQIQHNYGLLVDLEIRP